MNVNPIHEKTYHYLLSLFDTGRTPEIFEYLKHSGIAEERIGFHLGIILHLVVDHEVYKKYDGAQNAIKERIAKKYQEITGTRVRKVETIPDLTNFQIVQNAIITISTPWGEINDSQEHLIKLHRNAKTPVDFQNIGNASRTLLQKLANTVFNSAIHVATDPKTDLSAGKFKNRLHAFIRCELGDQNEELQKFATSSVNTAETAVDLANKVTHDLNATRLAAEVCAISTIMVVSIVKLISQN